MTEHSNIPKLKNWYESGKLGRREFLRQSTLLGMSATAAYSFVGLAAPGFADTGNLPKGGTIRMAMRVLDVSNAHAISFEEAGSAAIRPVIDYLVRTGRDNITRPWLLKEWEASEDLRTWTLRVRDGVKWHNGRLFTAEDVAWNLNHVLTPEVGSSVVGLMGGYMLSEVDTGEKDDDGNAVMRSELWDANAIEVVDSSTVRLNLKNSQGAIPEHLFHFPLYMLDPEEGGVYGVGSNGTGAYKLVEHVIGERAVLERVTDQHFMGQGPYLDRIEITDLGEDPNAAIGALLTDQVDGVYEISENQAPMIMANNDIKIYRATTAATAVVRGKMNQPPFDNPKVMEALRYASNAENIISRGMRGNAAQGDHTHVSPIHPEWADLGAFPFNPERARSILAEAGYPDGIDLEINVKTQPSWELDVVQVMVEDWAKAGINVKIQTLPASVFWDRWTEYPFSLTAWGHRPLGMMVLSLAYRTGAPWNESSFSDSEFDELLLDIGATIDPEERKEVMGKLMTIMRERGPIVQPFFMQVATAYNKRVKGMDMHPTKYIFFDSMAIGS